MTFSISCDPEAIRADSAISGYSGAEVAVSGQEGDVNITFSLPGGGQDGENDDNDDGGRKVCRSGHDFSCAAVSDIGIMQRIALPRCAQEDMDRCSACVHLDDDDGCTGGGVSKVQSA